MAPHVDNRLVGQLSETVARQSPSMLQPSGQAGTQQSRSPQQPKLGPPARPQADSRAAGRNHRQAVAIHTSAERPCRNTAEPVSAAAKARAARTATGRQPGRWANHRQAVAIHASAERPGRNTAEPVSAAAKARAASTATGRQPGRWAKPSPGSRHPCFSRAARLYEETARLGTYARGIGRMK